NKACTLPSLTKSDLSHLEITIPSIEEQNEFEKYVKHLDKSKFAIKEAMKNAQKIFDGILKESLK
ncbi:MAG: restriction endonuclease subunit S, partial [Lachnospiraceae bacterium]|nr:restriction endonuclease subunit S [Lachnospiraceae bacterium]